VLFSFGPFSGKKKREGPLRPQRLCGELLTGSKDQPELCPICGKRPVLSSVLKPFDEWGTSMQGMYKYRKTWFIGGE